MEKKLHIKILTNNGVTSVLDNIDDEACISLDMWFNSSD